MSNWSVALKIKYLVCIGNFVVSGAMVADMDVCLRSKDSSFTRVGSESELDNDFNDSSYIPPEYSGEESDMDESDSVSTRHVVLTPRLQDIQVRKSNLDVSESQVHTRAPLVPYDDSSSTDDDFQTLCKNNRGRKRTKCETKWKKNVRKARRASGKSYISCKGTLKDAKALKPPCKETCRLKCSQLINENDRSRIHKEFWLEDRSWDSKRQYVASCVKSKPTSRSRPRDSSRANERTKSNTYSFTIDNKNTVVCKVFFLNTLSVSESFVRTAQAKTSQVGMVIADQRGRHVAVNKTPEEVVDQIKKHILKYPAYESHYGREKSTKKYLGSHLNISKMYSLYVEECKQLNIEYAKEWLFRQIFNQDFNLSFHSPDVDTCDVCDQYVCQLKNASTEEERKQIKEKQKTHTDEASLRYSLKREDKAKSAENCKYRTVMADLQKCLPTPCLTNSQSFYLRKLWTLNYTISDPTSKESWCMVWDEVTGGRGGNEMASCFLSWANETILQSEAESLTVWTDNCAGQNRNMMMVLMYIWILHFSSNLNEVNHKFLLRGHTHMEVDGDHSIIERAKKHLPTNTIFTCNDWVNFIANCKKKPFHVKRMTLTDFKNFSSLMDNTSAPLISRKTDTAGEPFLISSVVWLQLRKCEPGILYFKTDFSGEFRSVDLRRMKRRPVSLPASLSQLRTERKKISNEKYKDLMTLQQWIPEEYRRYFSELPHGETGDFPADD